MLNVHKNELNSYDEWLQPQPLWGASGGWYWTNISDEVEIGASTTADLYTYEPLVMTGRQTYVARSAIQHEAPGREPALPVPANAWFIHDRRGIDLNWSVHEGNPACTVFNDQPRQSRVVCPTDDRSRDKPDRAAVVTTDSRPM